MEKLPNHLPDSFSLKVPVALSHAGKRLPRVMPLPEVEPSIAGAAATARGLPVDRLPGGGVLVTLPAGIYLVIRDPFTRVDPRIEAFPLLTNQTKDRT